MYRKTRENTYSGENNGDSFGSDRVKELAEGHAVVGRFTEEAGLENFVTERVIICSLQLSRYLPE